MVEQHLEYIEAVPELERRARYIDILPAVRILESGYDHECASYILTFYPQSRKQQKSILRDLTRSRPRRLGEQLGLPRRRRGLQRQAAA